MRLFTYYACIDACTSGNIVGISKIGYTMLARDCGLIGAEGDDAGGTCSMKVVDLTWIAVNDSMISKNQSYNNKARLIRWEARELASRPAVPPLSSLSPGRRVR